MSNFPRKWTSACLVCHEQTGSEGQLCPTCVEAGHRVENETLILNVEIRLPPDWTC